MSSELTARVHTEGGEVQLRSPAVGLWRGAPNPGHLVIPGAVVGQLEILGVLHHVRAPAEAAGLVMDTPGPRLARRPVAFDEPLLRLDPEASPAAAGIASAGAQAEADAGGLAFRSPPHVPYPPGRGLAKQVRSCESWSFLEATRPPSRFRPSSGPPHGRVSWHSIPHLHSTKKKLQSVP